MSKIRYLIILNQILENVILHTESSHVEDIN